MDLGQNSYSSVITQVQDSKCFVQLPSFEWYVELVSCHHETSTQYGTTIFENQFSCDEIQHDIRQMILASRIDNMIAVRIINTDNPYWEKLFLIERGEIFSFILMEKSYFCFIYREYANNKEQIYTNLLNPLFQIIVKNGLFRIINTLTDIVIFEKKLKTYQYHKTKENLQENNTSDIWKSSFLFVRDPLCEEVNIFLNKFSQISKAVSSQMIDENITQITVNQNISTILIEFLWSYTCIIHEDTIKWGNYIDERSAWDWNIMLPENFDVSDEIRFLDSRWRKFRFWLLELAYLKYLLKSHIHKLKVGIIAINTLDDARITFQRKLLSMTLEESERMLSIFEKQYTLLLTLLKNKIS